MWARIDNGTVAEITDKDPKGRFHPSLVFVACDEQVAPGWTFGGDTFTAPAGPSLDDLVVAAMARINAGYTQAMNAILAEYPDAETKTWDKQEDEARAYVADDTAYTPLIDAIADARSMDKPELVKRIIKKADAWISASGAATGKRQRLEDEVKAALEADDRKALETIGW